jgi:uncharacterized protein
MLLTLALSSIIGLMLGLMGGGGSILTVPMLVYLLHVEPKVAIAISFVVVGISSLMALIPHACRRAVCWKSGTLFGLSGMAGAFGGGRLAVHFSDEWLMTLFGMISLIVGLLMLWRHRNLGDSHTTQSTLPVCPVKTPILRLLFDGFFVGGLTGMVGVGGGFLIVPALNLWVGIPLQGAIGTSLLVITMNAGAGLLGYSQHVMPEGTLTIWVASGAVMSSLLGVWASSHIRPTALRKSFGALVIAIAIYVLSQTLNTDLITHLQTWLTDSRHLGQLIVGIALCWLILRIGYWIHQTRHDAAPPSPNT